MLRSCLFTACHAAFEDRPKCKQGSRLRTVTWVVGVFAVVIGDRRSS